MKLCILDRDGTINEDSEEFVKSPAEWQPLPGALEAIARINHAGWHVVVVTNQSGLGRGLFDVSSLNAMHAKMHDMLAAVGGRIDAIFYCPHTPEDNCNCRKPKSGLYEQIAERYGLDLRGMPTVGDSVRDLVAGTAVGCVPHLVLTGKAAIHRGQELPAGFPEGTLVHEDLAAFAQHLVSQDSTSEPAQLRR
jgi:D-glycero-D-manno-heptose 1,7-bisphosphate phosphatase